MTACRRHTLLAWTAALFLAVTTLVAPSSPVTAAPVPNKSIILYKPGTAVLGTLSNGVFRQKRIVTGPAWRGWTDIAVSRDTLLLYNAGTGRVRTGTFTAGVFTPLATRTLFADIEQVVASCDSVAFVTGSSAQTFTLRAGRLGTTAAATDLGDLLDVRMSASCDTAGLRTLPDNPLGGFPWERESYLLRNGRLAFTDRPGRIASPPTHLVHTATSYLECVCDGSGNTATGEWGTALSGFERTIRSATHFSRWTHVAGTADSVIFYHRPTGGAVLAPLRNGVFGAQAQVRFSPGWTIIAGGR